MKLFSVFLLITFFFVLSNPMIDKLFIQQVYRQKKNTLEIIGNLLFNYSYEPSFVAWMLSNIYHNGKVGIFESSNYNAYPEKKPEYLKLMDEKYQYSTKYSGKSIDIFSMHELGTLLEQLKKDNFEKGKFRLGCFQWTGSKTYDLFQIYNQERGKSDKISLQQATTAEGKMIICELKCNYSHIYNEWKRDNSNLYSTEASYNAGFQIYKKYEFPKIANSISEAEKRANTAKNMYLFMTTDDWDNLDEQYSKCINNLISNGKNEIENIVKCFQINIESDNLGQICGKNCSEETVFIETNSYTNYYEYKTDDNTIDISFKNSIETSMNDIEKENEFNNRTLLIQNMMNDLFGKLNISNIDSGEDEKVFDKNISIIMTSTKNQKKNENEKVITIDFGKCENILKNEYNISQNDSLYILQIISKEEEGMKIPKIEYHKRAIISIN